MLLLCLLVACSDKQEADTDNPSMSPKQVLPSLEPQRTNDTTSIFPKTEMTPLIEIDTVSRIQTIRAETQAGKGTLLMISNGVEEQGHMLASSTIGQEGDLTYQSNYSIVYRYSGKDHVLLELPDFLFIRPSDQQLSFQKLDFQDAELYILTPQYQTGHGLEGYVFAIDKQNKEQAFPLQISENGQLFQTLTYSEIESLPAVENEKLVVYHPFGPGGESEEKSKPIHYTLDLKSKQLVAE